MTETKFGTVRVGRERRGGGGGLGVSLCQLRDWDFQPKP